jgi:hypothetical protein
MLTTSSVSYSSILNPLNAQLNPIYHLLALSGAHHILHVSRIGVNEVEFFSPRNVCFNSKTTYLKIPEIVSFAGMYGLGNGIEPVTVRTTQFVDSSVVLK